MCMWQAKRNAWRTRPVCVLCRFAFFLLLFISIKCLDDFFFRWRTTRELCFVCCCLCYGLQRRQGEPSQTWESILNKKRKKILRLVELVMIITGSGILLLFVFFLYKDIELDITLGPEMVNTGEKNLGKAVDLCLKISSQTIIK